MARNPVSRSPMPPRRPVRGMNQGASDAMGQYEAEDMLTRPNRKAKGGKVNRMKAGGMCRGMGAATRGGNYVRG